MEGGISQGLSKFNLLKNSHCFCFFPRAKENFLICSKLFLPPYGLLTFYGHSQKVLKYFGGVTQDFVHVEGIGADTCTFFCFRAATYLKFLALIFKFTILDFKKNKAFNYAVSVPYTKVRINEVILAYEMNGEPL